jgi:glycosyltransferase involved in cell wall biosynthesis
MFTVLIPVYNHRAFLMNCVLSAVKSSLVSEVLLVDDGSSDCSADLFPLVCAIDNRVRVIEDGRPVNRGAPARLNQLAEAAQSDWLSVLNSDDLFAAGRFDAIVRAVVRGGVDLFFGDLVIVDGHGRRQSLRNPIRHNEVPWPAGWDADALADRGGWLTLLGVQNIVATTTNMIFNKQIFRKVGGFREYRYCHDWDFAVRCAIEGKIRYAPLMLSMYRLHATNTIKEARNSVVWDVRHMFANLRADYPRIFADASIQQALRYNPYLASREPAALAVVMPDSSSRLALAFATAEEGLNVHFAASNEDLPAEAAYLYAPADGGRALSVNDLRSLLLAIAVRPYDAFLLSRARNPYPTLGGSTVADLAVYRSDAAASWMRGQVRVLRCYTSLADAKSGEKLVDLSEAVVDHAFSIFAANQSPPKSSISARTGPPFSDMDKPIIFILPAFLAVGGVERIIIETMRQLSEVYCFVVVNTEALRPEQGSLHDHALDHAHVYDLAELVREEDGLEALAMLKDWYRPSLLWICNGSRWQIENAAQIRELFKNAPIVDHQAYDHEVGWIAHFGREGVRAADRFIAVNQRIRDAMIQLFSIPAGKIDLVYSGSDLSRLAARGQADIPSLKSRFGLPVDLPVFGMLGRLTAQKRPLDLVHLAQRLQARNFAGQLIWVGGGELEPEFNEKVQNLRLENLKLIPVQADLWPVYAILEGMIITSQFEGLPLVMLEALSMGTPVLSTDVGAIREVLERYESGTVFGPAGDIDALERAFLDFVGSMAGFRAAAERNAASLREEFSSERMAREYDACFKRAIAEFSPISLRLGASALSDRIG